MTAPLARPVRPQRTMANEETAELLAGEIFPEDAAYDSARIVWNRAIDLRPAVVVRAAGVDDVVRTVEFARIQDVRLAVRSGGHSQAGHGTCDDGIVLDLGSFRSVAVNDTARIVTVTGGARVVDVMDGTQRYGLLTPMGGCPDVGVGGLTLGGGENFLMARYGAVCDNLLSAEIVLADGRVVRTSEHEHPDLFWAIRGGSGNFGVATSFDYRLHPVTEVLSGQLMYPVAAARDAMVRYRDLIAAAPDELSTSGGLSPIPDGSMFFLSICYCGKREDGDRIAGRWLERLAPEKHNVKWAPYSSELSVPPAPSVGTGRFLTELPDEAIDIFAAAVTVAPEQASAVWNDFHGAVTRVAPDAMAFPIRRRGFDLFLSVPWNGGDDRAAAIDWSTQLADELKPFSQGVYVNNLNETEADRVKEAYGPHYERLAAIKAIYDPDNVFRVNHNIVPRR